MAGSNKIKIDLQVENIGPHIKTQLQDTVDALKVGIFAMNGEGKSFLSRMLALAEDPMARIDTTGRLLSFDCKEGKLKFTVTSTDDQELSLDIILRRDKYPTIVNQTGYMFHVFNNDYVKENLEKCAFSPSDDFEGYVIGKHNIDISNEETEVARLTQEGIMLKMKLSDAIKSAREDLVKMGVKSNTTELTLITYDRLLTKVSTKEKESYSELLSQYRRINDLPDKINDIILQHVDVDLKFLPELMEMLETPYSRADFTDNFLEKIRIKRSFIESGIQQLDSSGLSVCPFCEQPLDLTAKQVIMEYNQYLDGEEARVIKRIESLQTECKNLGLAFSKKTQAIMQGEAEFDRLKRYFPSTRDMQLPKVPDITEGDKLIEKMIDLLERKKNNIAKPVHEADELIDELSLFTQLLDEICAETELALDDLNFLKNNLNREKLTLRRRLCNASYEELLARYSYEIDLIHSTRVALKDAKDRLEKKQSGVKVRKSVLVERTFSKLLHMFFDEKYDIELDQKSFSLILKKKSLKNNAEDVLSDGEKRIIAFCYYIASTHTLVKNDSEYDQIFFVLDDPITNLDYRYVHILAQVIQSIKLIFPSIVNEKYLILTHHDEFMRILRYSKSFATEYVLKGGKITHRIYE